MIQLKPILNFSHLPNSMQNAAISTIRAKLAINPASVLEHSMLLMLDNLPADVTPDDLLELFAELGIPAPINISIAPGLRGSSSAAISFELDHAEMEAMVSLLNERFWRSHPLQASHSAFFH